MKNPNPEFKLMFNASDCLTPEVMKAYLQEKLTNDQAYEVEKHIFDCPFCNDALEGFSEMKDLSGFDELIEENADQSDGNDSQNPDEEPPVIPFMRKFRGYMIAASVVMLLGIGLAWLIGSMNKMSTSEFMAGHKPQVAVTVKTAGGPNDNLNDAEAVIAEIQSAIENEKYSTVVDEKWFPETSEHYGLMKLFQAQAFLSMTPPQVEDAEKALDVLLKDEDSEYTRDAKWLMGYVQLLNGDKVAAMETFEIFSKDLRYGQQAKEILEDLRKVK